MVKLNDLSLTSLDLITCYYLNGGGVRFTLDEPQNAAINNTQENTNLTGLNGRIIGTLKRNKAVEVTGTNGMLSIGLIGAETGSGVTSDAATVKVVDHLTVADGKATTRFKAVGTAGAEILTLWTKTSQGLKASELTQDATATAGKFAYDPSTKEISFHTDIADGTQIVCWYNRKITADAIISNKGDTYSEKVEMTIDATAEDRCHNVYHAQFQIPYADFNGNFNINLGGDQAVSEFTAVSLPSVCGGEQTYWNLIVFGDDATDIA